MKKTLQKMALRMFNAVTVTTLAKFALGGLSIGSIVAFVTSLVIVAVLLVLASKVV